MGESIPSVTVGGQSLLIPQLATGGFIEEGGLAQLHAGETVVPAAEVNRGGGGKTLTMNGDINITSDTEDPEVLADDILRHVEARF